MDNRDEPMEEEESFISRVGPWANKEEFDLVHRWLCSPHIADLSKALQRLQIWKLRRQTLTPATVMSTITILEVQLKDSSNTLSDPDLRAMYSNAFTKFMNYVSSIVRGREHTSMYATAQALGIHSFLVDLRHLCAHGQVLPALDMCRRTAAYCMNWMRQFYWDREQNVICDASVTDVRLKSSLQLEESVSELFFLYDAATKAIISGCKTIDDARNAQTDIIDAEAIELLDNYSYEVRNDKLLFIANSAINRLSSLTNSTGRDRGNDNIYFDILIAQKHFMKTSSKVTKWGKVDEFVGLHQNLFRLFAIAGFIDTLFGRLISICEDDREKMYFREGAAFWTVQIADGFISFKEFKKIYKAKKEKDTTFNLDTAPVNTDIMTDEIKKIYREIGCKTNGGKLIFGDTVRRPWDLCFTRDYILERVLNVNQYTRNVIERCVALADPPISKNDSDKILELMRIYDGAETDSDSKVPYSYAEERKIYTLETDILKEDTRSNKSNEEASRYGIWEDAPDHINWKYIPLGSFI